MVSDWRIIGPMAIGGADSNNKDNMDVGATYVLVTVMMD